MLTTEMQEYFKSIYYISHDRITSEMVNKGMKLLKQEMDALELWFRNFESLNAKIDQYSQASKALNLQLPPIIQEMAALELKKLQQEDLAKLKDVIFLLQLREEIAFDRSYLPASKKRHKENMQILGDMKIRVKEVSRAMKSGMIEEKIEKLKKINESSNQNISIERTGIPSQKRIESLTQSYKMALNEENHKRKRSESGSESEEPRHSHGDKKKL